MEGISTELIGLFEAKIKLCRITKRERSLALSAIFNTNIEISEIDSAFAMSEITKNDFVLALSNGKMDNILLNILNYDISHISTFI